MRIRACSHVPGTAGRCGSDFAHSRARPPAHAARRELQSPESMTSATVIQRIVRNRARFEARNAKKAQTEAAYYTGTKQYIAEV